MAKFSTNNAPFTCFAKISMTVPKFNCSNFNQKEKYIYAGHRTRRCRYGYVPTDKEMTLHGLVNPYSDDNAGTT